MEGNKMLQIIINKEKCSSCGVCVEACPADVLEIEDDGKSRVKALNECIVCRNCQHLCPNKAIRVDLPEYKETRYDKDMILV
jgi:NAD-dependent dihydropyrimidine dehydrogenase PreA subunit